MLLQGDWIADLRGTLPRGSCGGGEAVALLLRPQRPEARTQAGVRSLRFDVPRYHLLWGTLGSPQRAPQSVICKGMKGRHVLAAAVRVILCTGRPVVPAPPGGEGGGRDRAQREPRIPGPTLRGSLWAPGACCGYLPTLSHHAAERGRLLTHWANPWGGGSPVGPSHGADCSSPTGGGRVQSMPGSW